MQRLTDKQYWDAKYLHGFAEHGGHPKRPVISFIKRLLGPRFVDLVRPYSEFLLWDVIYPQILPRNKRVTILEVGSAPGENLVEFWKSLGYQPYGVEYSEPGVRVNRQLFSMHGLDPANVIHADFLSQSFQDKHRGQFDIVISHGFIEHFSDPTAVIAGHLNLLRSGGHLVVSIPNLRGVNRALVYFFNKETLPLHNLSIMNLDAFCNLFEAKRELVPIICRYYGTFSFRIFNTKPVSPKRHILRLCGRVQQVLNVLFRLVFAERSPEIRSLSPYLLFIGTKKESASEAGG